MKFTEHFKAGATACMQACKCAVSMVTQYDQLYNLIVDSLFLLTFDKTESKFVVKDTAISSPAKAAPLNKDNE